MLLASGSKTVIGVRKIFQGVRGKISVMAHFLSSKFT
jgi:hypothetical protein